MRSVLLVVAAVAALVCPCCGDRPAEAGAPPQPVPVPLAPAAGAQSDPSPPPVPTGATDPGGVADRPEGAEQWHAVVDRVLDAYGEVLTELVADPAELERPDSDLASRWRSVVVDGALSDEVVGRAVARLREEQMVIRPGPDGRAYRHVVIDVEPLADDARPDQLAFTWCGTSPGLGVHVVTGDVLDDAVALGRGTGSLRRVGDTWRLETLDELDHELLPRGAADPCRGP